MQSNDPNKSSSNINGQKTLLSFYAIQKDKESQENCSLCGESFLASKISWHRDFECIKRLKISNFVKKNSKKKSKSKCISNKKSKNLEDDDSQDVIILDDFEDFETPIVSTSKPGIIRSASPNLFDINININNENQELENKNSLIEDIKRDWDSPSNSPVKPLKKNVTPVSIKIEKTNAPNNEKNSPIKSSDFSLLSYTDSEDEFENNDVKFSPTIKKSSRKKENKISDPDSSILKKDDETNVSLKSELIPLLLAETTYSEVSNLSCEDTPLNSPALVSPERTPTPSPDKSARKKTQTLTVSSQILFSPKKFSLKKRLSDMQTDELEVNINFADGSPANSGIKKTPFKVFNSIKKSIKNGYLPNNSFKARRDLFSYNSNNMSQESPTKKFVTSPNKYRNVKGMYLDNFLHIIDTVTSQPQDVLLFSDEDLRFIQNFYQLSLESKKLYVRLFQRKVKWNKVSKIEYKEICDKDDMLLYINELVYAEFLLPESQLSNLKDVLTLLDVSEVRKVCKDMKLQSSGNKEDMIARLIKSDRQQKSILTFCKSTSNESQMLKMAKEQVGKCFILQKEVWNVFMRILHLYSPTHFEEDEENGQQTQLTALLMISIGKLKFPDYRVYRENSIYRSRDDLIRFQTFMQMEFEIQDYIKNQKWDEAVQVCKQVEEIFREIENDKEMLEHDKFLPPYLRRFTTMSLICHIRTLAVEIYQRQKHYGKAVKQLEQLLAQKSHRQDCRGRWYDRLALNLHQHLKRPAKALSVIKEALEDPEVRVGHRLSLSQRAEKLLNSKSIQKQSEEIESQIQLMEFLEAPRVCIQGKCLPADIPGVKRIFLSSEDGIENNVMCSVEELALNHYKREGYCKGLHCEGRIIGSLFGFFFWDVLYLPIPDVFRTRHQAAPLDLDAAEFYTQRKKTIDRRVKSMTKWTLDEANKRVENVWIENENSVCLIDWKLFSSLEFLQGLIAGLGLKLISAICDRLAKDHRFTRSGFPDLVVWNPSEKKSRIVEVKGPNDKLSTKQVLWLDYLIKNGAEAEVCHVEAVGQKRTGALKSKRISPRKRKVESHLPDLSKTSSQKTTEDSTQKPTKRIKRKRNN